MIELLVVIAIIGILAAVVLASLNDARDGGKDASAKGSMTSIRNQAELYYNANNYTYEVANGTDGVCDGTNEIDTLIAAVEKNLPASGTVTCVDTADSYHAYATLNDTSVFCVDSKGFAGKVVVATPTAGTPAVCNPLP